MKILFGDASHLQIKQENDENIRVTSKISLIHLTTIKLHALSLYCMNLYSVFNFYVSFHSLINKTLSTISNID